MMEDVQEIFDRISSLFYYHTIMLRICIVIESFKRLGCPNFCFDCFTSVPSRYSAPRSPMSIVRL